MRDDERDRVDLWLAFAAGEGRWVEGAPADPTLDHVTRLLAAGSLLVVVTWATVWTVAGTTQLDTRQASLLAVLVVATAVLAQRALTPARRQVSLTRLAAERIALATAITTALAGITLDLALLGVWPLGAFIGADLTLTSWALGLPLDGRHWRTRFLLSFVNLGVVVMLGAAVVVLHSVTWTVRVALLYATFLVCIWVAGETVRVLAGLAAQTESTRHAIERRVLDTEHRERGHWLHDVVLNDLRGVRLHLERAGGAVSVEVAGLLDDLDDKFRMQQLEEYLRTGSVPLAEVVSPALRRAQRHEVAIQGVTGETGRIEVAANTGRLVERAISVFVNNAVVAGTPMVAVRLDVRDDEILVEVEDATGGFDLADAPVGRGLDRLRNDLGADGLASSRTPDGTIMLARVRRRSPS